MIDLSRMKGLRVDSVRRVAQAQPGLTLRDFDRETHAFGLATTMGTVSMTGIAGLTLGGGLGWLMGKFGLACDNVLSLDVVTADARLLAVSAEEHSDLYWGMRGAGPNYGVVTSFEYGLHPLGPVLAGVVAFRPEEGERLLKTYRDFSRSVPVELTTGAGFLTLPDGTRVVVFPACYAGKNPAEGEAALRPLRARKEVLAEMRRIGELNPTTNRPPSALDNASDLFVGWFVGFTFDLVPPPELNNPDSPWFQNGKIAGNIHIAWLGFAVLCQTVADLIRVPPPPRPPPGFHVPPNAIQPPIIPQDVGPPMIPN